VDLATDFLTDFLTDLATPGFFLVLAMRQRNSGIPGTPCSFLAWRLAYQTLDVVGGWFAHGLLSFGHVYTHTGNKVVDL
jgi:hypothetical protein